MNHIKTLLLISCLTATSTQARLNRDDKNKILSALLRECADSWCKDNKADYRFNKIKCKRSGYCFIAYKQVDHAERQPGRDLFKEADTQYCELDVGNSISDWIDRDGLIKEDLLPSLDNCFDR